MCVYSIHINICVYVSLLEHVEFYLWSFENTCTSLDFAQ